MQYNIIWQIYIASKVSSESQALPGSKPCCVHCTIGGRENNMVFKWDLKVESEGMEISLFVSGNSVLILCYSTLDIQCLASSAYS